jgi:hypothetical protein
VIPLSFTVEQARAEIDTAECFFGPCANCEAMVHISMRQCPACGHCVICGASVRMKGRGAKRVRVCVECDE